MTEETKLFGEGIEESIKKGVEALIASEADLLKILTLMKDITETQTFSTRETIADPSRYNLNWLRIMDRNEYAHRRSLKRKGEEVLAEVIKARISSEDEKKKNPFRRFADKLGF